MAPRRGRTALLVALSLVAGVLTTALVAFIAAATPPSTITTAYQDFIVIDGERYLVNLARWWGTRRQSWNPETRSAQLVPVLLNEQIAAEGTSRPESWSSIWQADARHTVLARPPFTINNQLDLAAGWPFLAFTGSIDFATAIDPTNDWLFRGDVLKLPRRTWKQSSVVVRSETRLIPLHPLWPGLLANSLLFATAWYTAIAGSSRLRRAHRRRRCQCTQCKYDLRGTPAGALCPECGTGTPHPLSGPPTHSLGLNSTAM